MPTKIRSCEKIASARGSGGFTPPYLLCFQNRDGGINPPLRFFHTFINKWTPTSTGHLPVRPASDAYEISEKHLFKMDDLGAHMLQFGIRWAPDMDYACQSRFGLNRKKFTENARQRHSVMTACRLLGMYPTSRHSGGWLCAAIAPLTRMLFRRM